MESLKLLLLRYAKGTLDTFPTSLINANVEAVLEKIDELKATSGKSDVSSSASRLFPEHLNVSEDDITNVELITICRNNHIKDSLLELSSDVQKTAMFKGDDASFDWNKLVERHINKLQPQESGVSRTITAKDLRATVTEPVICSWGYPLWDFYLDGGVTPGSYTVLFAISNVGKSTTGTANFIKQFVDQGMKVLVYYLEHNPKKFVDKVYAQWAGCFHKDRKDYTPEDIQAINNVDKDFDIILYGANSYRTMQSDVLKYKPDIIIFDQITVASGTKEWQKMAEISSNLARITREYGTPVIAMTQSNLKGYQGAKDKQQEKYAARDAHGIVGEIKYSQSIYHDATTVLELRRDSWEEPTKRLVTIRKSKDDSSVLEEDITFVMKSTPYGIVCTGKKDAQGMEWSNESLKIPEKRTKEALAQPLPKVADDIDLNELVVEEPRPIVAIPVENGFLGNEFGNIPTNLFSQEILDDLPNRLNIIGSHSGNKDRWERMAEASKTITHTYGDNDEPTFFNEFRNVEEFGRPYKRFYL